MSLVVAEGKNGRRYAWPPDTDDPTIVPSVTTILGNVARPGLVSAAGWEVAHYATENILKWSELPVDDAAQLLAGVARRVWNRKAELGTDVHDAIEKMIRHGEMELDAATTPYVAGAAAFLIDHIRRPIHIEETVFNLEFDYAGRPDLIAQTKAGPNAVIDWKSGKVGADMALQLNAYAHARFVGKPDGTQVTLPAPIDQAWVVQLPGDGTYKAHPVAVNQRTFKTFLAYRTIQKWVDDHEDEALGEPTAGGEPQAAPTPQGGN